jgi:hypothetical protein
MGGLINVEFSNRSSQSIVNADNSNKINETTINSNAEVNIGHGHGRIENVEDAVEAIYILNDLSKINLLTRNYTEYDIKVLADKITLIRKERYFDERIYKQKAIKELFSLLMEIGLIKSENIDIFNVLNDYHFLAGIVERPSGHKIEYYFTGGMTYYGSMNSNPQGSFRQKENSEKAAISIDFYYEDPISIKWQQNFIGTCNLSNLWITKRLKNTGSNDFDYMTNAQKLSGKLDFLYSIGYYPDTRTYCGLTSNVSYSNIINSYGKKIYQYLITVGIGFNSYYYLSEKLRLSGIFNIYYHDDEAAEKFNINSNTIKIFSNNLNLELTYYIF